MYPACLFFLYTSAVPIQGQSYLNPTYLQILHTPTYILHLSPRRYTIQGACQTDQLLVKFKQKTRTYSQR
jgi:hypothetical protein